MTMSWRRSGNHDLVESDRRSGAGLRGFGREALRLEPLRIEQARLIFGSTVAEHGDDGVPGAELPRDSHGRGDIDTARAAEEEAFLTQQTVDEADGLGILDVHGIIDGCVLEIGRDA